MLVCQCIQVNSNSLVNADHHRAVAVLKEAGNDVAMVVERLIPVASVLARLCISICLIAC